MNEAGKKRAEQMAHKEYTLIEYRNRLVRMQNMDCVCHCSAEIDMGTLLYFSVNDMYLGQGDYVILLFSEVGGSSPEQKAGRDVFGRMFTYAVIEEIAKEAFTGRYSFYSSELDGHFVMILNFHFGILPDGTIVDFLDDSCRAVSARCKELYDMDVVTYVSKPIDNIQHLSAFYAKLLETANLHRYTNRHFPDPVYHVPLPQAVAPDQMNGTFSAAPEKLFSLLSDSDQLHEAADKILCALRDYPLNDIDNLKKGYGQLFERLCKLAQDFGIRMKFDLLREEQFRILFDSISWEDPAQWMHHFLDQLSAAYRETVQKAAHYQLSMAMRYIDESLSDPGLTIDSVAQALGYSVSTLSKAFRRQMNTSAAKYIRDKRLEMAWELLHSGCSVADTGKKCGFGSAETFHRAFKSRYAVTPGRIRGGRK